MGKASKKPKKFGRMIKEVLRKGFRMYEVDKSYETFKRVVASASQTRVKKRLYTSLDPDMVRERGSFGAKFGENEVIMKMEARFGQLTSTSHEIDPTKRQFSFDIMPDAEFNVKTKIEEYDLDNDELVAGANKVASLLPTLINFINDCTTWCLLYNHRREKAQQGSTLVL